ncbi:uncharacterized protein LOC133896923 [Phragmites australis]|uniref:uncharacterized protein LOC133896923 n=1 Tax=Phragmites australis TaxID=29695 RepID=UPI002D795619|nr:uncharacterized protein LOC133896923 [Phragmites australis]
MAIMNPQTLVERTATSNLMLQLEMKPAVRIAGEEIHLECWKKIHGQLQGMCADRNNYSSNPHFNGSLPPRAIFSARHLFPSLAISIGPQKSSASQLPPSGASRGSVVRAIGARNRGNDREDSSADRVTSTWPPYQQREGPGSSAAARVKRRPRASKRRKRAEEHLCLPFAALSLSLSLTIDTFTLSTFSALTPQSIIPSLCFAYSPLPHPAAFPHDATAAAATGELEKSPRWRPSPGEDRLSWLLLRGVVPICRAWSSWRWASVGALKRSRCGGIARPAPEAGRDSARFVEKVGSRCSLGGKRWFLAAIWRFLGGRGGPLGVLRCTS